MYDSPVKLLVHVLSVRVKYEMLDFGALKCDLQSAPVRRDSQ